MTGRRRRERAASTVWVLYAVPVLLGAALIAFASSPSGLAGPTYVDAPAAAQIQAVDANVLTEQVAGVSGVDGAWLANAAARTQIPARALQAYAGAEIRLGTEAPSCHLAWNTIAAIAWIESGHGSHADAVLEPDGRTSTLIIGPALDGHHGHQAIPATTETSEATGDPDWDHAVGPLQFIGSTWRRWGSDASGDGVADPNNIDDAAYTAGRYLCADGRDLTTAQGWTTAILAYNHSDAYVEAVRTAANEYAAS